MAKPSGQFSIFYNERGAIAILTTTFVLAVILLSALTAATIIVFEIKMAREAAYSVSAFFAADAGAEQCLYQARKGTSSEPCYSAGGMFNITLTNGASATVRRTSGNALESSGTFSQTYRKIEVSWSSGGAPPSSSQCNDGLDNDGDTLIDWPADPGCLDADDIDETDALPPSQSVINFTLVNADTDNDIGPLNNGDMVTLSALPTTNLNVRANTNPGIVGSVRFAYDGNPNYNIENAAPYALAGDSGGDYNPWTPSAGAHFLAATPYSEADANGTAGTPLTINFDVQADTTTIQRYRSVGTNSGNLNTQSRTVTISGNTATFSGVMPDNIGVGDVLQYQNGATYLLAFIHGRTNATTYTVYTSSGSTPTATTSATVNVYRAYTRLANWESQTENTSINSTVRNFDTSTDLTAGGGTVMNVAAYGDGADTTAVAVDGWTTGASNYIRIYTATSTAEVGASQRHSGKWDDTKYRLEISANAHAILSYEGNIRIDGLQTKTTQTFNFGINIYPSETVDARISNNIIKGLPATDMYSAGGIQVAEQITGGTVRIWNNVIYDFSSTGEPNFTGAIAVRDGQSTTYVYNNTIANNKTGIAALGSGAAVLKNNISFNNTDNYSGTFTGASNYNLSGPSQTDAPGANSRNGVTVTFVDATNKDFHLAAADAGARNYGTDLSADSNLAFTTDIDGETRPATWDIGADEY